MISHGKVGSTEVLSLAEAFNLRRKKPRQENFSVKVEYEVFVLKTDNVEFDKPDFAGLKVEKSRKRKAYFEQKNKRKRKTPDFVQP